MSNMQPPHKLTPSVLPTIIGLAAIIFGLDQLTKHLVLKYIPLEGTWGYFPWLDRLFRITFIRNPGAAFGTFPEMGTALMGIALLVIVAIIFFHRNLPVENIWVRASLGLQLGGAMGNLLDRVIHGYVVDFVDIGFWPIFNIADCAIVLGVSTLAYFLWQEENQPASSIAPTPAKKDSPADTRQPPAESPQVASDKNGLSSLTNSGNL